MVEEVNKLWLQGVGGRGRRRGTARGSGVGVTGLLLEIKSILARVMTRRLVGLMVG